MGKQSLFGACKRLFRDQLSGTYEVGNNNIFLELYTQEDITNSISIGNSSEDRIVVVAGDTITIPSGYTLTPVKPKKSLVIICNNFVNNGTVSMYKKAPNVLPHDLFIIDKNNFGSKDIIIPAYANNAVPRTKVNSQNNNQVTGVSGVNGTNRNCGSGGTGCCGTVDYFDESNYPLYLGASGSGYAFGGGAGSGGIFINGNTASSPNVNTTYPMRGGNGATWNSWGLNEGGVGYTAGKTYGGSGTEITDTQYINNTGCGGRIIIFCKSFTNNGTITVNGTNTKSFEYIIGGIYKDDAKNHTSYGGASGAGAVDLFYRDMVKQGTITAAGGSTFTTTHESNTVSPGKGGNGSITLTAWQKSSILKPIAKYMSKANMVYFLTEYITRLKQGED